MKKREQIESELRTIIKSSKKNVFVKLSLSDLIKTSRRMYVIFENYKSGEKFKIKNNDENILLLNEIESDFQKLNSKLTKIPTPIKALLDRKWEQEPNSKKSTYGSTELILNKLSYLQQDFKNLVNVLVADTKNGTINNIDPIPIAIVHSAMTIWIEVLKNKYNLKNRKILSKNLLIYLEDVLEAFIGALYLDCENYNIIRDFIFNLIEEFLDLPEIILKDTNFKDQILRYFQHNFKVYPTYHHIDKLEDEEEFKCEILKEDEVICIGSGKTKKKAEQNASYNALVHFNVLT